MLINTIHQDYERNYWKKIHKILNFFSQSNSVLKIENIIIGIEKNTNKNVSFKLIDIRDHLFLLLDETDIQHHLLHILVHQSKMFDER